MAVAALLAAGRPAAAETPDAFLRGVYTPFLQADSSVWPTGPIAPTIFDAPLLRLIRKDEHDHEGEVGALDQDPICACQDFGRLTGLSVQTGTARRGRVTAIVRFFNDEVRQTLRYALLTTFAGWRVADIAAEGMPSLVALLRGVAAASVAPHAARSVTPASLMHRLYAPYLDPRHAVVGDAPLWTIFDTRLAALIEQDDDEKKRGVLDRDPVCACQVVGRLTGWSVEIRRRGTGHAVATASFADDATPLRVTYELVSTPDGWRVADIGGPDGRSLAAELEQADGPPGAALLGLIREKAP